MTTIGFIGLGNMGAPDGGEPGQGRPRRHRLRPRARPRWRRCPRPAATSPPARPRPRRRLVVITMLPAGEHVRDVYLHQGGLIDVVEGRAAADRLLHHRRGQRPHRHRRRRDRRAGDAGRPRLRRHGRRAERHVDLHGRRHGGSVRPREAGAGGDGQEHLPCRRPGAGQAVKICNNMMLAINMVGVSEGFLLARNWGWTGTSCTDLPTATANSWALSNYCPAPGPVPPRRPIATTRRGSCRADGQGCEIVAGRRRGNRIAHATGREGAGVLPAGVEAGDGDKDFSVVFRWLAGQKHHNRLTFRSVGSGGGAP